MGDLIGKWVQIEGQPYEGLWFNFKPDGTFEAEYDAMGIVSAGTYATDGNIIDMNQTEHTFGLVGEFKGILAIKEDVLKLALASSAGHERPGSLEEAREYQKEVK